jgi:hypothetical protein
MAQFAVAHARDPDDLLAAPINFAASGDNTIASGPLRVFKLIVAAAGPTLDFQGWHKRAERGDLAVDRHSVGHGFRLETTKPWLRCASSLVINSSAAVQVSGIVYYQ